MKQLYHLLFAIVTAVLAAGCSGSGSGDSTHDITSDFRNKWNIHEDVHHNGDGTITYECVPWGGLSASYTGGVGYVDWSGYDRLVFEFVEPTTALTQVMLNGNGIGWGNAGVKRVECRLNGSDISRVKEVALQCSESTVIKVKRVYLTHVDESYSTSVLWEGKCALAEWSDSVVIPGEKFYNANEGDVLELVYHADVSDPEAIVYWQFKTIYFDNKLPLDGNYNDLNEWGAANVPTVATSYRIPLSANDIMNMSEQGLMIIGHYLVVTQCNLLQSTQGK